MTAKFFAILTTLGAAKLANATALGTKLDLTQMSVGDGGGSLPTPDSAQTALKGEKRRAAINMLSVDQANPNQIIAEQVIPENEGGWWIREIGLFDKDGTLIAVANCPETYKPQLQEGSGRTQTIRMVLIVSSTEAVTLKIDPSVVLATRDYVDNAITAHAKSRNHPDASTGAKGFVQLSSAIDSTSEVQAATPKAIKMVSDAAAKLTQNLADLPNKSTARKNLELGSAAVKDTGKNVGNLMTNGDFGIGGATPEISKVNTLTELKAMGSGKYAVNAPSPDMPSTAVAYELDWSLTAASSNRYGILIAKALVDKGSAYDKVYRNALRNGVWQGWVMLYDEVNKPSSSDIGALNRADFPVGIPQPWPTATAPTGWLKCNGATFDKAMYPLLAVAYPTGRLPDLRAEFIRGLDDGRGIDPGRGILTAQEDSRIRQFIGTDDSLGRSLGVMTVYNADNQSWDTGWSVASNEGQKANSLGCALYGVRPRNTAFNYIVRAA